MSAPAIETERLILRPWRDEERFAGCVALQDVPFEAHFTPALEVGWRLCADAWGCGYATEGGRALLGYAFGELKRSEVVRLEQGHRLRPHVLYRSAAVRDC